jgi:hypothetical protein
MSRIIDLAGPEGNVAHIAGIAKSWNYQIGLANDPKRGSILDATTRRLGGKVGDYNDVLDTFDLWFEHKISYEFVNDPREPVVELDDDWFECAN